MTEISKGKRVLLRVGCPQSDALVRAQFGAPKLLDFLAKALQSQVAVIVNEPNSDSGALLAAFRCVASKVVVIAR